MVKYPSWTWRSIAWSRPVGTLVTVVAFAQALGIGLLGVYRCSCTFASHQSSFLGIFAPIVELLHRDCCDSCTHVWVDATPNTVQSGVLYSERSFRGQGLLLPSGAYPYIVDVAEGPFPACNGGLTCAGFSSSKRILLSRSVVEMYRMVVMPSRDDCLGFWS